jgi:stearoyl-CoA desaturase (delta-9 desaturase)
MQWRHLVLVRLLPSWLGIAGTAWAIHGDRIRPVHVIVAVGMYALSWVGLEVGFHRGFAHSAFKAKVALRVVLGILGSWAGQGPLFFWVALHRVHHAHADTKVDPHTPWRFQGEPHATRRGLWFAFMGWMVAPSPADPSRQARDVVRDRVLGGVNRFYYTCVLSGILLPSLICGLATWSVEGALVGLFVGGLLRLWLVHLGVAAVTVLGHFVGKRTFATNDHSTDNPLVGLLTFGQGFHNHHHAFPAASRYGTRAWDVDMGWWVMAALLKLGAITSLRYAPGTPPSTPGED